MTRFSIIVPVFNRQDFLRGTLDAIVAAAPPDTQIIAVDDGSTDDSVRILESYGPGIEILRQHRRGPGAARNRGLDEVTGDYIAFMDSDDLFFPWAFTLYRSLIERYDRPSLLIAAAVHFCAESELRGVREQPATVQHYPDYLAAASTPMWHGTSVVVARTECVLRAGGFAEAHVNAEDSDFLLRMGTAPGFVRIMAPATVAYRTHAASATADTPRSMRGILHMAAGERNGRYPGGRERSRERATLITRHSRAMSVTGVRSGLLRDALALYVATIRSNLKLLRLKYLLGFPLFWLWHAAVGARRPAAERPVA